MNGLPARIAVVVVGSAWITVAAGIFIGLVTGLFLGWYVGPAEGVTLGTGMCCMGAAFIAALTLPISAIVVAFPPATPLASDERYLWRHAWLSHRGRFAQGILFLTQSHLTLQPASLWRRQSLSVPLAEITAVATGWNWWKLSRGIYLTMQDGSWSFLVVDHSFLPLLEAARRGEPLPDQPAHAGTPPYRKAGIAGLILSCIGVVVALAGWREIGLAMCAAGFLPAVFLLRHGTPRAVLVSLAGPAVCALNLAVAFLLCLPAFGDFVDRSAASIAILAIDEFHGEHQRLPNAAEAKKLIDEATDGPEEVRFTPQGPDTYVIRAPGADQKFDTPDDVVIEHTAW